MSEAWNCVRTSRVTIRLAPGQKHASCTLGGMKYYHREKRLLGSSNTGRFRPADSFPAPTVKRELNRGGTARNETLGLLTARLTAR